MDLRDLVAALLLYGVFPLWLLAGLGDYVSHRMTVIAQTSGTAESALHAVQFLLLAAGVGLGLLCEITTLVLLAMTALVALHTIAGFWDVAYTYGKREIGPFEQHVHSYLETLPLVALALVALLYWDQAAALFGGEPDFGLHRRVDPLPERSVFVVLAGLGVTALAIGEELHRTRKFAKILAAA